MASQTYFARCLFYMPRPMQEPVSGDNLLHRGRQLQLPRDRRPGDGEDPDLKYLLNN